MRKRWYILIGLVLLLPAALLPLREQIRENRHTRQVVSQLLGRMEEMEPEKRQLQQNLAKWYNRNLTAREQEPGFQEAYGSILDLGEGMMGVLRIPELDLALPITHGEGGAVGHDPNSAFPIGGRGNHTILYLREDRLRRLPEPGGPLRITVLGTEMVYRIESVQIMSADWPVERENTEEDLLTLVVDGRTGLSQTRILIRCVRSETSTLSSGKSGGTVLALGISAGLIPFLKRMGKLGKKYIHGAEEAGISG